MSLLSTPQISSKHVLAVPASSGNAATHNNIESLLSCQIPGGQPQTSLENEVLMILWYITGQESYLWISNRFNSSKSIACDATFGVLQTIHDFLTTRFIK